MERAGSSSAGREVAWTVASGLLTAVLAAAIMGSVRTHRLQEFWGADFVQQYMPVYADIDRAVRVGQPPLLSDSSWYGGNLVGEYQYGALSVAHLAIVLVAFRLGVSLSYTGAAIVLIYTAITASGAFRLGRHYGLTAPLALIVSQAAALNGYSFFVGASSWPPALASFAWLPWTWWALSIALDQGYGLRRFLPAGVSLYFLLAAGWPFTVLMVALVTVWLCLKSGGLRHPTRTWPIVAAWSLGLALAAPAILSMVEYYPCTDRALSADVGTRAMSVPLSALPALIYPASIVEWVWIFSCSSKRPSYELYCGLVPGVALLAGAFKYRTDLLRKFAWEFGLLGAAALLCHFGAVGTFRCPFRWLPLFHLLIGLLGALVLQRWLSEASSRPRTFAEIRRGSLLGFWAILFVVPLWVWALYVAPEAISPEPVPNAPIGPGNIAPQLFANAQWAGIALLAISLLWMFGELLLRNRPRLHAWVPPITMAVALLATYHLRRDPVLLWNLDESLREAGVFDKDITYFALQAGGEVYESVLARNVPDRSHPPVSRVGCTPMYASLRFVNGYSAMFGPHGYNRVFGTEWFGSTNTPDRTINVYAAPGGLLERMGVDGLVLGRRESSDYSRVLERLGWQCVAKSEDGAVFHRSGPRAARVWSVANVECLHSADEVLDHLANSTGPLPDLLVADPGPKAGSVRSLAKADISEVSESRLFVRCEIYNRSNSSEESVLAFARQYYPGYRAIFDGREVPVKVLNGFQVSVVLPPGRKGALYLYFIPKSFVLGCAFALTGALVIYGFLLGPLVLPRRPSQPSGSEPRGKIP